MATYLLAFYYIWTAIQLTVCVDEIDVLSTCLRVTVNWVAVTADTLANNSEEVAQVRVIIGAEVNACATGLKGSPGENSNVPDTEDVPVPVNSTEPANIAKG